MSNDPDEGIAAYVRRKAHSIHIHAVSEFAHLGYFATAAGLMHEYHSVFAGACGLLLAVVIVLNVGGGD